MRILSIRPVSCRIDIPISDITQDVNYDELTPIIIRVSPPTVLGSYVTTGRFGAFVASSVVGMALLLALEAAFLPPDKLPHLYAVLNALFSGANLTVAYVLGVYWQWQHRVDKHEKLQ